MEIVKIHLASKNNKKTGNYLYCIYVKIDSEYWYCKGVLKKQPTKTFTKDEIIPIRIVDPKFYQSIGLK